MKRTLWVVSLALGLAGVQAHAQEALTLYDDFASRSGINLSLWREGEVSRAIEGRRLSLMQRSAPPTTSAVGRTAVNLQEDFKSPERVTAIGATVTVERVELGSCSSNTGAVGEARAQIVGQFFNDGTGSSASGRTGDIGALIRVTRQSNAADPADVLWVRAWVWRCANADCSASPNLNDQEFDLGTVKIGRPVAVLIQWDQPNHRFLLSRDGVLLHDVYYGAVYTSDMTPPYTPFKSLLTRLNLPNCANGGGTPGAIRAGFDNILVNGSAVQ